jgi:hypothetical protein
VLGKHFHGNIMVWISITMHTDFVRNLMQKIAAVQRFSRYNKVTISKSSFYGHSIKINMWVFDKTLIDIVFKSDFSGKGRIVCLIVWVKLKILIDVYDHIRPLYKNASVLILLILGYLPSSMNQRSVNLL